MMPSNPTEHPDLKAMWKIMYGLRQQCEKIEGAESSETMPLSQAESILREGAQKIADTVFQKWQRLAKDPVPEVVTSQRTSATDVIPILISKEGEILSMPQFSKKPNIYQFPGGKASIGETACQGALREAEEELQLSECLTDNMVDHPGYLTLMHVQSHPDHDTRGLCSFPFVKFIVVEDERKEWFSNLNKMDILGGWFKPSDDFAGKVPYHFSYTDFHELVQKEKQEKQIGHMRFRQTLADYLSEISAGGKVDIDKINKQNISDIASRVIKVAHFDGKIFTREDLKTHHESSKIKETILINKKVVQKISQAFEETQRKLVNYKMTSNEEIKWDDVRWFLLGSGDIDKTWSGLRAIIEYPIRQKLGKLDKKYCLISTEAAPLFATYLDHPRIPVPRHMSVEEAVASSLYQNPNNQPIKVTVVSLESDDEGFTAKCEVQKEVQIS